MSTNKTTKTPSEKSAYQSTSRTRRSSGGMSPRGERKRILLPRGASGNLSSASSKTTPNKASGSTNRINTKAIAAGRLDVAKYCKPENLVEEKSAFFADYRMQHAAMGLLGSPTGLDSNFMKSRSSTLEKLELPPSPSNAQGSPSPSSVRHPRIQPKYNPQFTYALSNKVLTSAIANKWPNGCSNDYMPHAERILATVLDKYGTFQRYQEQNGGRILTHEECQNQVNEYLEMNNLTDQVFVNYDPHLVARASMTTPHSKPTLNLRPRGNRQNWLQGTLDHELGTHFMRDVNNQKQTWGGGKGVNRKMRKRLKMDDKNPTEEGLAALHTVLSRVGHSLWRPALMYYTCYRASELSFAELFDDLHQYIESPEERWDFCLRAKRGLADTSQPGGCPKDQMYLTGAMQILSDRNEIDFHELYMGKVSVRDARRLKESGIANVDSLTLPTFVLDQLDYKDRLNTIVTENNIRDLVDGECAVPTPKNLNAIEISLSADEIELPSASPDSLEEASSSDKEGSACSSMHESFDEGSRELLPEEILQEVELGMIEPEADPSITNNSFLETKKKILPIKRK
eukprot:gene850-805_t